MIIEANDATHLVMLKNGEINVSGYTVIRCDSENINIGEQSYM